MDVKRAFKYVDVYRGVLQIEMAGLEASLESTPTWAVAGVCSILILSALAIEHALHELTLLLKRRKRKTLNQALNHVKAELRNLGFMSLLLTVAKQPISKICIPTGLGDSFLPCKDAAPPGRFTEEHSCQKKGKISLVSSQGTQQLQLLIIVLAVFHILCCLVTLLLGEVKMKRWKSWEEETKTLDYQLSNDPRRFNLLQQTAFGERHLKSWSNHNLFIWIVCFFRQFTNSVSKADYFSLRHGFIAIHFSQDCMFDFRKYLQRTVDKDFAVVVSISFWIWMFSVFFIFFNAYDFYSHYWLPFIPLVILLVIGTKLEVIITTMCLKSSNQAIVIPGTLSVELDNKNFWFGQPRLLLHLMQFILIQNSFQLAFFTWAWYNFGLRSCFHRENSDIILTFGIGILVEFLCAYVTLPLYALVTQMGSSMKETIFTDEVINGLKDWKRRAKKNLARQRSLNSNTSLTPSLTSCTDEASTSYSKSKSNMPRKPEFKFPSGRLELLEVQRVVQEIIQHGGNNMPSDGQDPNLPMKGAKIFLRKKFLAEKGLGISIYEVVKEDKSMLFPALANSTPLPAHSNSILHLALFSYKYILTFCCCCYYYGMQIAMASLIATFLLLVAVAGVAESATVAPGPKAAPLNLTGILEKGGQYVTFLRLLKETQVLGQIESQLNSSFNGLTIFAPTDNAFNNLKAGTLNSLTTQEQVSLVLFHVLPRYYSPSTFETTSNPVNTQASGSNGVYTVNITSSSNQVNVSTGVNEVPVNNNLYMDFPLAVYSVDKVLLPSELFGVKPPSAAPAPVKEPAGKGNPKAPATADAPEASADQATPSEASFRSAEGRVRLAGILGLAMSILLL
ncbi:MLO-like protein 2 [Canna indica]|uniref:MLO-like protein 2 n=1 Tax=Canna indica TaxID=4628 RepID=A0AAQ3QAD2_9LILI|nr:MLO-like protein 2 [Canna indica]